MNPVVKEKWLAALRSGEYKQGRYRLAKRRLGAEEWEYCCLGVLCELAIQDGVKLTRKFEEQEIGPDKFDLSIWEATRYTPPGRYGDSAFLPEEVADWAGLDRNGKVDPSLPTLPELNDEHEQSFDEIAVFVQEHL